MSAPTINALTKAQLYLFEWFTFTHYGKDQQFLVACGSESFRVCIKGSGLPVHFDYPEPIAGCDNTMRVPRHLRVRQESFVLCDRQRIGHSVGYDFVYETVVAYDKHHRLCWRSDPITNITVIEEI